MGKLQDFLMGNEIAEATKEVMLKGFPEPFVIHSITEAENKKLRKASEIRYFDKKTHRQEKETDNDAYNTKLIVACCTEPNFKDAQWQEKKGVRGAEALVELTLKSGDYNELLSEVLEINGFYDDNINDLREEAKKLITGGELGDEGADGEANYAHYCIHRLKLLPHELFALPLREQAFLFASIDLEVKNQKKEAKRAEQAARK